AISNTVAVTVFPKPDTAVGVLGATEFCQGDSVTLTAAYNGGDYVWSNGQTTRSIVVKTSGSYHVQITGTNGCASTSAPIGVTVNPLPVVDILANGPVNFCAGDSVVLTASSPTAVLYNWSNLQTTAAITVKGAGTYSVTVTDAKGCMAQDGPVTVNVGTIQAT
ncbi:MAG: hypothetical protein HC896_06250, partial [Bacteroidales bacterium]|nr:hypothetical protein [Bacteroidales bacterium]